MSHESFFFSRKRNRLRYEQLENLVLLNTTLGNFLPPSRTPYKIFVNSVPKSGTNLLMKTLSLFPTVRDSKISLHSEMDGTLWRPHQSSRRRLLRVFPSFRQSYELGKAAIVDHTVIEKDVSEYFKIGGFHNVFVPPDALENALHVLKPGWYAAGHMPYSTMLEQLFVQNNFRMLLIIRDPRDVIYSELKFLLNTKKLTLHNYYQELDPKEGVISILQGCQQDSQYPQYPDQPAFRQVILDYLPWLSKPYVFVARFEDLVGPKGGGKRESQTQQIEGIARHLNFSLSPQELEYIEQNAFGGTHTFRKGTIAAWQQNLAVEQKLAVKESIGDLLIELGYEDDEAW